MKGIILYIRNYCSLTPITSAEGIAITDKNSHIIEVNDAFCKMTGYVRDELIDRTPNVLKAHTYNVNSYDEMWASINETRHWRGELHDKHKNGTLIPLLQTINRINDNDHKPQNYISVITDITALKETEHRLEFLAHHDILTKLPNRLLFHDRLDQAIERAKRAKSLIGIIFIDLDHFKNINDTLGHNIGDKLLQKSQ